jgi:hypothetical protein
MRKLDAYASAARIIDDITDSAIENEHLNGPGTYDTWTDAQHVVDTYSEGEAYRENLFREPGLLGEVTEGVRDWLSIMRNKTIYGGDAVWGDMSDDEAASALGIAANSGDDEIEAAVDKAIESADDNDLIISKGDYGSAREAVTEAVRMLRDKLHQAKEAAADEEAAPAVSEFIAAVRGDTDMPKAISPLSFLRSLITSCHGKVYEAICEDAGGDWDSINVMLNEVTNLHDNLQKLVPECSRPLRCK